MSLKGVRPINSYKGKPWTGGRLARRISKHIVFYLLSFVIANFFLSYIIGIKGLYTIITEPVGQHVGGLLSIALFSGVFYGVYAFFREQVCTVICPYGRLQGVLLDKNSMIVAYDYKRGNHVASIRRRLLCPLVIVLTVCNA